MDIRREIGMRHGGADIFHLADDDINGLKEIESNELHSRVDPVVGQGSPRGNDDFGPVLSVAVCEQRVQ